MNGIEAVTGLAALKYLFSGKNEFERKMDSMMQAGQLADAVAAAYLRSDAGRAEWEARQKSKQQKEDQAQYERIGKLLAHIQRFP